jgi:sensor c-di-GMP phosphodiesterase-like protein
MAMGNWRAIFSRGQRASDHLGPAPVLPRRDPLLEAVIAREQIGLLFQPQIEPATGRIAGAEALARWNGAVSPEQLFARAAAAGLAERLSRLIQRKALRLAGAWEGPLKHLGISINLLPEDLARSGYEDWLHEEIERDGVDPRRVTIEITENAIISYRSGVDERQTRLSEAGVSIAVDDFGTGY